MDNFSDLPIAAQAAAVCFVVCATTLFTIILAAPQRDCFFFRWTPPVRILALMVAPTLLIFWPIVLFAWFSSPLG